MIPRQGHGGACAAPCSPEEEAAMERCGGCGVVKGKEENVKWIRVNLRVRVNIRLYIGRGIGLWVWTDNRYMFSIDNGFEGIRLTNEFEFRNKTIGFR